MTILPPALFTDTPHGPALNARAAGIVIAALETFAEIDEYGEHPTDTDAIALQLAELFTTHDAVMLPSTHNDAQQL